MVEVSLLMDKKIGGELMVLKEAFEYQNYLNALLASAEYYLSDENNFMVITDEHLRSKSVASAEDMTDNNLSSRQLSVSPNTVINFIMTVYSEKRKLAKAIDSAKCMYCESMDRNMSLNKTRQQIMKCFKNMLRYKGRESITCGSAYTMNADGNQIEYRYDIKRTSRIDFERANLKKIISELSDESSKASITIDNCMSSVVVDHNPLFDLNDTFEELVENYGDDMSAAS